MAWARGVATVCAVLERAPARPRGGGGRAVACEPATWSCVCFWGDDASRGPCSDVTWDGTWVSESVPVRCRYSSVRVWLGSAVCEYSCTDLPQHLVRKVVAETA